MKSPLWLRALTRLPQVSAEDWQRLGPVSRWLVSVRAAVLVLTLVPALLAGFLAWRDGYAVNPWVWLLLTAGLVLAHAANNLANDFTDWFRGVDRGDYLRTRYAPHPLAEGLVSTGRHLKQFLATLGLAALAGLALFWLSGGSWGILLLMAAGSFFLLAYTWPLKAIGLGEISVLVVWGPLMLGGGYFTLTGHWSWQAVWLGLPTTLGATAVIFGKHLDKAAADAEKGLLTLPVLIGSRASRVLLLGLLAGPFALAAVLWANGSLGWSAALVLLALPEAWKVLPRLAGRRPAERPDWLPLGQGGWPLYYAPLAFALQRVLSLAWLGVLLLDLWFRRGPG